MGNNKQSAKGSDINQQDGNQNTNDSFNHNFVINNMNGYQPLTETQTYDLLKIIMESDLSEDANIELTDPTGFYKKLKFNGVVKYKGILDDNVNEQMMITQQIQDLENADRIIKKLHASFLKKMYLKDQNPVPGDGDKQLNSIFEEFKKGILSDPRFPNSHISEESVDEFVYGLLGYGISICKVLINPNEGEG